MPLPLNAALAFTVEVGPVVETHEMPMHDPEPTPEQLKAIGALTSAQIASVDAQLLSNASARWRKVAFVVGSSLLQLPEELEQIPDTFLAQRVRSMVDRGLLESQGNLLYMRFSEVRLTSPGKNAVEGGRV